MYVLISNTEPEVIFPPCSVSRIPSAPGFPGHKQRALSNHVPLLSKAPKGSLRLCCTLWRNSHSSAGSRTRASIAISFRDNPPRNACTLESGFRRCCRQYWVSLSKALRFRTKVPGQDIRSIERRPHCSRFGWITRHPCCRLRIGSQIVQQRIIAILYACLGQRPSDGTA